MTLDADTVRRRVSADYSRAVEAASGAAAARDDEPRACCSAPVPGNVAARAAGYEADDLRALPESAVAAAFGCGDPVAVAGIRPGEVVVDLGAGAGIDIILAGRKVGPAGRVIGVDMTDAMIEHGRRNVAEAGLDNVELRKGLIEAMPVDDASVDWVISNCVINLSPEKPRVFGEIARVLRPGGRMLVSDLVVDDMPEAYRNDPDLLSGCLGGAIGEAEYVHGLREAGLVDVEVVDRVVYDEATLVGLMTSEGEEEGCGCSCIESGRAQEIAHELGGRVASIRVTARRPVLSAP
jgi:SAM-dependent methyltransferase